MTTAETKQNKTKTLHAKNVDITIYYVAIYVLAKVLCLPSCFLDDDDDAADDDEKQRKQPQIIIINNKETKIKLAYLIFLLLSLSEKMEKKHTHTQPTKE